MDESAWDKAYEPMDGPTEGDTGNWSMEEVKDVLATGTIVWQQVWTVVDDGEAECAVSGWAVVNRQHHKVTKKAWTGEPGDIVVTLTVYCLKCGTYMEQIGRSWVSMSGDPCEEDANGQHEVDGEDGAPCCPDPGCGGNPCTFPGYAANH